MAAGLSKGNAPAAAPAGAPAGAPAHPRAHAPAHAPALAERRSRCERILALIDACLDEVGAPGGEEGTAELVSIGAEHEGGTAA